MACARLSSASAAAIADLEVLQLGLELLDGAVCHLEVLVQAVALGDQL